MAARTLQGEEISYQGIFPVETGKNPDLAVAMFHRPRFSRPDPNDRFKRPPEHRSLFLRLREERYMGEPELPTLFTFEFLPEQVTDTGLWNGVRCDWELRGYVLNREFARKGKGRDQWEYARAVLKMDTERGTGTLYILAHDQPQPIIEVIEWCQMVDRVGKRAGQVVQILFEQDGTIRRGIIKEAHFYNDRFEIIVCGAFYKPTGKDHEWVKDGDGDAFQCLIPRSDEEKDAHKPLAFRDGRIVFSVPRGSGWRAMCTVYPHQAITWK